MVDLRMDPSEQIKPCSVQIVDLRRMKNPQSHLPDVTGLEDPNYTMQLPSSPPYSPDQTDETVWIKEECRSPVMYDYDDMTYEDGEGSDTVYDLVYGSPDNTTDKDMGEPYPNTMTASTHGENLPTNMENLPSQSGPIIVPESVTSLRYKSLNFDPPLTHDLLAAIMIECYGIDNPDVHTLTVLREQMEERPKLKIKLLEDLYTGNGKMKKKKKKEERKASEVTELIVPINWEPYKPLTLAQATAHVAATKSNVSSSENGQNVEASSHRTPPRPEYTIGEPSTSTGKTENNYVEHVYDNGSDPMPSPDLTTPTDDPGESTPRTLPPSAPQDSQPDVSGTSHSVPPPGTIQLAETSDNTPKATYSPSTQTVTIPELPAAPPGAMDVLIPVDYRGQMKAPYIGIPLNTCHIVHAPNAAMKTETSSRESSPCTSTSRPGSAKPDVALSEPHPTGIIPIEAIPPGTIPPGAIPPGTKPVGIIPANMYPPGLLPRAGVPPSGALPGTTNPSAFPHGLGPFRIPIVRPQYPCTCPRPPTADQSRPPFPPGVPVPPSGKQPTIHVSGTENKHSSPLNLSGQPHTCTDRITSSGDSCDVGNTRTARSKDQMTPDLHEDQTKHRLDSEQSPSVNSGSPSQPNSNYFGGLPGSHLKVILPLSAQSSYKPGPPSAPSVTPVTTKAFAEDLALMWNEISSVKTEMRFIKTSVATEIHDLRNEMEDFMKLVGDKLGIPLSSWTHRSKSNDKKRKVPNDVADDDDVVEVDNVHKRAKMNDTIDIT